MHAHRASTFLPPTWPDLAEALQAWRGRHPGALAIAGLLAFAAPVKFFVGFLGVATAPSTATVLAVGAWWSLFGAVLWGALLAAGALAERAGLRKALWWVALAFACAAAADLAAAGRARVLIEHGLVQGALGMHLYAILLSSTLAMLYFAHLERCREHQRAAARLAAAQAAQREARRRFVQVDLQAVQARIAPDLLFGMLEAVRHAYVTDPPRAEHLLDELVAFLRASLPRLRTAASSLAREGELARACVRLLALAQGRDWRLQLDLAGAALHARFPPGALLPLVDSALRTRGGDCMLHARCEAGRCRVTLRLPAAPAPACVARVQALLWDTDGPSARVSSEAGANTCLVTLEVCHEPA